MKKSLNELTQHINNKTLDEHSQDNFDIPPAQKKSFLIISIILTIVIAIGYAIFSHYDTQILEENPASIELNSK